MLTQISEGQKAALERLIDIALRDTGQSRIVANFLLAWWNADECGGFKPIEMWGLDSSIAIDVLTVFSLICSCRSYPDTLGYNKQFQSIIKTWRAELVQG